MSSSQTGAALSVLNVQCWSRAQQRGGIQVKRQSPGTGQLLARLISEFAHGAIWVVRDCVSRFQHRADFLQTSQAEILLQAFLRRRRCSSVQQQVYLEEAGVTCSPFTAWPRSEAGFLSGQLGGSAACSESPPTDSDRRAGWRGQGRRLDLCAVGA